MMHLDKIFTKTLAGLFIYFLFGISNAFAQSPGDPVKFDIRGNVYSDTPNVSVHDWFIDSTFGVIDTTNTALYKSYLYPLTNTPFQIGPSFSQYALKDSVLLYDALYARDYVNLNSLSKGLDSTIFQGGSCKNGANPSNDWSSDVGTLLEKNDIVDAFAHVRREGVLPDTGNLWINFGLATFSAGGSRYVDFEIYKKQISLDTGVFSNSGPDEGHSSWKFDTAGNVTQTGDLIVGFEAKSTSVVGFEVRIWVKKTDFTANKVMSNFTFGAAIDGRNNGSKYGYAQIVVDTTALFGDVSAAGTKAPPWHTIYSTATPKVDSVYDAGIFVEAAVNLTNLGIDPALGVGNNLCGLPFSRILVKTRTSGSFTSTLKDFAGPYRFLDVPVISATIALDNAFSCEDTTVGLVLENLEEVQERVYYRWETNDGLFLDSNNVYNDSFIIDTSARIVLPGTYYLITAPLEGCVGSLVDSITIHARPCAIDDKDTIVENCSSIYNVLNNAEGTGDTDLEDDIDTSSINNVGLLQPQNGTVFFNTSNGEITYIPNPNWIGTDSFEYQICDLNSPALCDTGMVVVTVLAGPVIALNDMNVTWMNTAINGSVLTNDRENAYQELMVTTTPISDVTKGSLLLNSDGSYSYTPTTGFTGLDSFIYLVCDTASPTNCAIATAYIIVDSLPEIGVNDAIIANNDYFITIEDTEIKNTVLRNDYDSDGENDNPDDDDDCLKLTLTPVRDVVSGSLTLNPNGSFNYMPNSGFVGNDTFVYQVCDEGTPSKCVTATAIIEVLSKEEICNCPPIALDDYAITESNTPVSGSVISNDYDLNSDTITIITSPISGPSDGSIVINSDGTYTYTPDSGFVGTDQVVYEIRDTTTPALSAKATLYISVSSIVRDYSDLPSSWPTAYTRYYDSLDMAAGATACWLGDKISNEASINQNATATADAFDDGLIQPIVLNSTIANLFQVVINANKPGVKVFFKLSIDWDNDGAFDSAYVGSGISGILDTVGVLVNVSSSFTLGTISYRLVAQTDSSLLNSNVLVGGEIEDYQFSVTIPLPVELLYFSAKNVQTGKVALDWATSSEIDNDYFDVEHSTNGIDFNFIGRVEGNGNSQQMETYSLLHHHPKSGVNYYRLKQVDFNGEFEYSEISAVTIESQEMLIYPNPVKNILRVQVKSQNDHDEVTYEVIDQMGKTIKAGQINLNGHVNVGGLRQATYILKLYQGDTLLGVTRFMKF